MTTVYRRGIAKLVRHRTLNPVCVGSSPATPANQKFPACVHDGAGFIQLGISNEELKGG